MAIDTLHRRILNHLDLAEKEINSPVMFRFDTCNDCNVSPEEMQKFMRALTRYHRKLKIAFGHIVTIAYKKSQGYHYHGVVFLSGRDYGHQQRFSSMIKHRWSKMFKNKTDAIWVHDKLWRVKSQKNECIEAFKYLEKKTELPPLDKGKNRFFSSNRYYLFNDNISEESEIYDGIKLIAWSKPRNNA